MKNVIVMWNHLSSILDSYTSFLPPMLQTGFRCFITLMSVIFLLFTVGFEMWHLELITGLVILISSCRYLLLKTWPDFAESSEAANQQVTLLTFLCLQRDSYRLHIYIFYFLYTILRLIQFTPLPKKKEKKTTSHRVEIIL